MKKILFVCTGNTCRSPMAEAFFNDALKQNINRIPEYSASSAGISALPGFPASEYSKQILKEAWGIDISDHRASAISYNDIKNAHLVLAMEKRHKDILTREFPEYANKIYTLNEFVSGKNIPSDIRDPFGGSLQHYKQCAEQIYSAIQNLIDML